MSQISTSTNYCITNHFGDLNGEVDVGVSEAHHRHQFIPGFYLQTHVCRRHRRSRCLRRLLEGGGGGNFPPLSYRLSLRAFHFEIFSSGRFVVTHTEEKNPTKNKNAANVLKSEKTSISKTGFKSTPIFLMFSLFLAIRS